MQRVGVTYTEHFDGVFSAVYGLQTFPFDAQTLRFEYQPFLSAASEFRFASQPLPETGISPGKYTELAAWQVRDLQYSIDKTNDAGIANDGSRAVFQVLVKRRSAFYVWKVFVPLFIMTLIPAIVFWIDVKEFDWLLKVPMTMLLATVAFEFVVSKDLPKTGYATLLDTVFLVSIVFFSICMVEITTVFLFSAP